MFIHFTYTFVHCTWAVVLIFKMSGCFSACHIENIKTVANLSNNKDVFMCILRFLARAGYLQHYETLFKELNTHPATDPVPPDQYEVEHVALSDRN
jgi:hypothetical protein